MPRVVVIEPLERPTVSPFAGAQDLGERRLRSVPRSGKLRIHGRKTDEGRAIGPLLRSGDRRGGGPGYGREPNLARAAQPSRLARRRARSAMMFFCTSVVPAPIDV